MLTLDEQEQIRAWVRTHYPRDPLDKIRLSEIHIAAYQVIGLTLGVEWCDRMVKPLVTAPVNDFLRRGIASRDDSLRHVDRIIYLAEYLTRLSTVPNFNEKVKDLRNYGWKKPSMNSEWLTAFKNRTA